MQWPCTSQVLGKRPESNESNAPSKKEDLSRSEKHVTEACLYKINIDHIDIYIYICI